MSYVVFLGYQSCQLWYQCWVLIHKVKHSWISVQIMSCIPFIIQQTWKSCTRSRFAVSQNFSVRTLKPFAPLHWGIPGRQESNARVILTLLEPGSLVRLCSFCGRKMSVELIWEQLDLKNHILNSTCAPRFDWGYVGYYLEQVSSRKVVKIWTWTSVGGSVSFWLSATEKPAAKVKSRSKILILFLSWKIQSERPMATAVLKYCDSWRERKR